MSSKAEVTYSATISMSASVSGEAVECTVEVGGGMGVGRRGVLLTLTGARSHSSGSMCKMEIRDKVFRGGSTSASVSAAVVVGGDAP
jgi:hypothetical protein